MGTEAVKMVYFKGDSSSCQAFWRLPDGSFQPVEANGEKIYLKDRRTGSIRLIQG